VNELLMRNTSRIRGAVILATLQAFLLASAVVAADTQARNIPNGSSAKVRGIIVSRDGDLMRVREEGDSVVTVALSSTTKVTLKHGLFGLSHTGMEVTSLVPGLRVEAEGAGDEKGQLLASKVSFDPNDLKAARSIDTRVAPLEARTTSLEGRAGQLEGRAGQLETRSTDLESRSKTLEGKTTELADKETQTDQQVAEVNASATKANNGVSSLGGRVSALDDYETKGSATVYFAVKSTKLTEKARQELDALVESVKNDKGFMIEVAGFADSSGNAQINQELSQKRAQAVVQYLQEQGNVPLRRILAPAGLGTSHSVADNTTKQGRQQNRRVEVRVLVNRGLAG
jgi:OmpA-OmpF porin, OOP family